MKKVCLGFLAGLISLSLIGCSKKATGDVALNFIHWRSEDTAVYEELIRIFEERNPGFKVQMDVRSANQDEYYAVLKTKMSGTNDSIDILAIHPGPWLQEFSQMGLLVDLTNAPVTSMYVPDMVEPSKTDDGKVYGLPQCFNAYLIFYNQGIFSQYGLVPPKTWADMQTIAKTLRDNGHETIASGFAESWVFDLQGCPLFSSYNPDNPRILIDIQDGRVKWTAPNVRAVFEDLQKMNREGFFINGANGTSYEPSLALFAQGRAAMLNTGSWSIGGLLEEDASLELGFFVLPNSRDEQVMSTDLGQLLAINTGSPRQEQAMKFLEFLSSPEAAQIYADGTAQFSAVKGVQSSSPELEAVTRMLGEYKSYRAVSALPMDAKFLDIFFNTCSRAFAGEDIDALLTEAQTATDNLDL
jgi:raffinose/stachyose/melibiose transport system substrate-binding protein